MADLSFLKDFEKECSKMEGIGSDDSPPRFWFSSGNYALNYIMSGDFKTCIPQGRLTAMAGPSSAGKSFIQCSVAKTAQNEDDAYVVMIDSENSLDAEFTSKIGINVEEGYNYKSAITIDSVINLLSTFIASYRKAYGPDPDAQKVLIVIDSLDMLITATELGHFAKGDNSGDQGQRAKQLKAMLRQLVHQIKDLNIAIVVTHQVYAAKQDQILKGEGVWVINDAVRYSLSQIALLTRLKLKEGTEVTGIRMKCEGFKTRFTKPFQNVVIEVPYDTGMDPCSGLCEVMESAGVLEAAGSYKRIAGTDIKFYRRDIKDYLEPLFEKFKSMNIKTIAIADESNEIEVGISEEVAKELRKSKIMEIVAAKKAAGELTVIED
jgi:RecA/RadA recombinase